MIQCIFHLTDEETGSERLSSANSRSRTKAESSDEFFELHHILAGGEGQSHRREKREQCTVVGWMCEAKQTGLKMTLRVVCVRQLY